MTNRYTLVGGTSSSKYVWNIVLDGKEVVCSAHGPMSGIMMAEACHAMNQMGDTGTSRLSETMDSTMYVDGLTGILHKNI